MSEFMDSMYSAICVTVLPPALVFTQVGCTKQFWLNLILTLFGWMPGVFHALWIIVNDIRRDYGCIKHNE